METGHNSLFGNFRTVICAAGLTATAAGAVFLFCRWPKETVEIGTQTVWETAEASTQAGWETADAVTQALWEVAEASTQAGWETSDAGNQAEWETVEAGIQAECERMDAGVQAVRETAVSATQAVWHTAEVATQLCWTDGLIQVDLVAPLLVHLDVVNGQWQTPGSYLAENHVKLQWDVQTIYRSTMMFTWSNLFHSGPGMVGMRRCSGETVEGSLKTQFSFLSDDYFELNSEGNRETYTSVDVATFIKSCCGDIVHAVSQKKQESRLWLVVDGVQVIQTSMTYKRVTISADGSVRRLERSETTLTPAQSAAGPTAPPGADTSTAGAADDAQSFAQGSEDSCLLPEAREVPSLFYFCQSRNLEDFPARLKALRQAFTTMLRDQQQCNYITIALRLTLVNLAMLNQRDVHLFQQAFDGIVAYVQNPENALAIQAELLEAGIHHLNALDIAFELVLFGIFEGTRPQLVPQVQDGFLDQLFAVVQSFLPSGAWSPDADQYQKILRADIVAFLEEVISLELSVYSHPQTLADGLFLCLEHRVDQLLSRLPTS